VTFTFNLITKPWIPVLRDDGSFIELGLRDVLNQSPHLREVAHDSPLFVASIYSLLAVIMHRVLPGRTDRERKNAWKQLWNQKSFSDADVEAIDAYFARLSDRFDLFHPRFPFYQVAGLDMNEASALRRLAMEENNTPALFANDADPDWQFPSPALAARLLVTIQNFALGFGKSSRAKITGEAIEPPYSADGPLLRGLTIWASGDTLFQTLLLCLVPHELPNDDAPCWELDEPHKLRDQLVNGKRRTNAPRGVCDFLTLQSRLIRLLPEERNGAIIVPRVFFTQGRSLEKDAAGRPEFHPLKLYTFSKKEGFSVLSLSEKRAIWRNAHALLNPAARSYHERNLLGWMGSLKADNDVFDDDFQPNLNVVGMAIGSKPGKFLLWRHDRLPLPPKLLVDLDLVGLVESANKDARDVAEEMRRRFAVVARTFIAGAVYGGNKPNPDDVKALVDKFDPRRAYWSRLEQHFNQLLERLLEQPEAALEDWEKNVHQVAQECLRAACNSLGTSLRAITAVAQIDMEKGLHPAYLRDPKSYLAKKEREEGAHNSEQSERIDVPSSIKPPDAP
jgi:CRISPR system Cascade subunit CasA